jgi:alpha-amylase
MRRLSFLIALTAVIFIGCKSVEPSGDEPQTYFTWDAATIYFLLTDRFYNGNTDNDYEHSADAPPAHLRGYMGGDFAGITQKIEEGYFEALGVDALWISPVVEQIASGTDEGTGFSYAFHGYWTKDWTAINPIFGTAEELRTLVRTAHDNGLRVLLDVVINHTGPVTKIDPEWPASWVKTGPNCTYKDAETTVNCTLVDNLPDIRTENREQAVDLPPHLLAKWKQEGRYDQEVAELEAFFTETGYPRTPYHHIIKWIVDMITEFGFDGFRVDTVKHTEPYVWADLWQAASKAWTQWKADHPDEAIDDAPFYMMGEVYGYYIGAGRMYDYGDQEVDFFKDGFHSMINFDYKYDAVKALPEVYARYDSLLHGPLAGKSVVNYISSHDDGSPLDKMRTMAMASATNLLLAPGAAQVYYGDESARILDDSLATGDAKLRSFMNWEDLESGTANEVINHWRNLGLYRQRHPAIGAGRHHTIQDTNFVFARTYSDGAYGDTVVVAMHTVTDSQPIPVGEYFAAGSQVRCAYTGRKAKVVDGHVTMTPPAMLTLLEKVDEYDR